eukprot:scaffold278886_cov48-Attheya_sp.AAC.1
MSQVLTAPRYVRLVDGFVGGLVGLVVRLIGEFFGGGFIRKIVGGLIGDLLVVCCWTRCTQDEYTCYAIQTAGV